MIYFYGLYTQASKYVKLYKHFFSWYDTKPSDGEAPVLKFKEYGVLFHYHYSQVHSAMEL